MKKVLLCLSTTCFIITVFHNPVFAQEGQSPESYLTLAQSHEKVKAYKLAADNYMMAGKGFEEKAKTYTTSGPIKTNLTAARDAYAKARDNYRNAKDADKEKDALQQAVRVGLLLGQKNVEEKNKEREDEKSQIKQIPWKPGKKIIMAAKEASFEMTMPEALIFSGPVVSHSGNYQGMKKNQIGFTVTGPVKPAPYFKFYFKEETDDGGSGKTTTQSYCDDMGKLYAKPGATAIAGTTEVKTIGIGNAVNACLITKETRQIDTKNFMFGWELVFFNKKTGYVMTGSAPYAWKTCILEMLKTFRIMGEAAPPKPCGPSEEYLLENLAFEKIYKLPDESKDVRIVIEPYLARNKVSDGWHLITQTIMDVLSSYQELSDNFDLLINGKKAFYGKPGEFKDWVKLEIIMRSVNLPDVSPTNVIQGYIDVFDKTITAISGLENKISNMTVNLSWELPYINVTTKCIPRFICINGKMEPDKKNLAYRYVSKGTQTDRQVYQNLTPNQAVEKREKVLNRFLNEIKKDAEAYANAKDCSDFTNRLFNVKFPVAPDECARRQTTVAKLEAEQKSLEAQKINLGKRINSHNATRQARIDERNKKIQQNEKIIIQKKETRRQKEELKKNYENSNAANKAALIKEVEEQLTVLNIQIGNLVSETLVLEREKDDLVTNKFERELKLEVQAIDDRMKKLKEELTPAQNALNNCR